MQSQDHNFTVHPHILFSIIQAQAGTLGKALLEGVMNSIDAGATKVAVTLTRESFTVRDDGKGFQNREEVLNWFGQFGTPHEEGDAIYGRFRMGRGQMMAFGLNTWRTGTFRMDVDIKGKGLDYRLTEKLAASKGCFIKGMLYQALTESGLQDVITEFTNLVRYAQIPVSLNGRVISKRPELVTWDAETDDAYIKTTRTGDLLVYNLGVLVRSYANYQFGCGGVVVSKRALKVNFARNDVLIYECDTWGRISDRLKRENLHKVASKSSLNSEERRFLAKEFTYGNMPLADHSEVLDLKLITDATGKHHSIRDLRSYSKLAVASDAKQRTGARLHREGRAFVLSQETLERFRVDSLEDLLETLSRRTGQEFSHREVGFDKLAHAYSESYHNCEDSELPHDELCALLALRHCHERFYQWFRTVEKSSGQRELRAGISDVADAWTDGMTVIHIERKLLKRAATKGAGGFFELLMTMVHEYCHDTSDLESHDHDMVFYTKHHDIVQYRSGRLVTLTQDLLAKYQRLARKAGVAMPETATPASTASSSATKTTAQSKRAQQFFAKQIKLF